MSKQTLTQDGSSDEQAKIEEAMRALDDLRREFDLALANGNTVLAASLLEDIELTAAALDEIASGELG